MFTIKIRLNCGPPFGVRGTCSISAQKTTKETFFQDLLAIENTDSDLKVHTLHYANELLNVCVKPSFWPKQKYHVISPKYLSGNSKKDVKMSQKFFLISQKILLVSRNISCFCFKNKPILNPLGQNFPQRELKSISETVYTSITEIKQLSKQHG